MCVLKGELDGECSHEKGGKAEINTGLIDSTRPHAKLYQERKYQGLPPSQSKIKEFTQHGS